MYDQISHFNSTTRTFNCPFDFAEMEFRGGTFAAPNSCEADYAETLTCPCCGHSLDVNQPMAVAQRTHPLDRLYRVRRAAVETIRNEFAAIAEAELVQWWLAALRYEATIEAEQAALVAAWEAEQAALVAAWEAEQAALVAAWEAELAAQAAAEAALYRALFISRPSTMLFAPR